MTETIDTVDRVAGGLYGVAYGDAMGMPGELWSRRKIRDHFDWIDHFLPGPDGHFVVDGFVAGQVTDDTQQTEVLAETIIERDGVVDAQLYAQRLVEWADRIGATEGNFLGPSSARALQGIRDGKPLAETGASGDTNGAGMRIVPVGLAIPVTDGVDALVSQVVEACRPTHFTDVAISGACLIAAAVSAAVDAMTLDDIIAPALEAAELGSTIGNTVMGASVDRRAHLAIEIARRPIDDDEKLQELYDVVGATVATPEAIPTALGLAIAASGVPARCARLAANLGGDTDTIGAMATGICGALAGKLAIPADDLDVLQRVNDIDFDPIAQQLAALRATNSRRHRRLAMPTRPERWPVDRSTHRRRTGGDERDPRATRRYRLTSLAGRNRGPTTFAPVTAALRRAKGQLRELHRDPVRHGDISPFRIRPPGNTWRTTAAGGGKAVTVLTTPAPRLPLQLRSRAHPRLSTPRQFSDWPLLRACPYTLRSRYPSLVAPIRRSSMPVFLIGSHNGESWAGGCTYGP